MRLPPRTGLTPEQGWCPCPRLRTPIPHPRPHRTWRPSRQPHPSTPKLLALAAEFQAGRRYDGCSAMPDADGDGGHGRHPFGGQGRAGGRAGPLVGHRQPGHRPARRTREPGWAAKAAVIPGRDPRCGGLRRRRRRGITRSRCPWRAKLTGRGGPRARCRADPACATGWSAIERRGKRRSSRSTSTTPDRRPAQARVMTRCTRSGAPSMRGMCDVAEPVTRAGALAVARAASCAGTSKQADGSIERARASPNGWRSPRRNTWFARGRGTRAARQPSRPGPTSGIRASAHRRSVETPSDAQGRPQPSRRRARPAMDCTPDCAPGAISAAGGT